MRALKIYTGDVLTRPVHRNRPRSNRLFAILNGHGDYRVALVRDDRHTDWDAA